MRYFPKLFNETGASETNLTWKDCWRERYCSFHRTISAKKDSKILKKNSGKVVRLDDIQWGVEVHGRSENLVINYVI